MFQNVSRGKYCPQDPLGFAEVQFPDFVLTQFLCFGTNFVAFCINHNTKSFRTSKNTYLLPSECKLGVIQQLCRPNLPNFDHLPPPVHWTIVDMWTPIVYMTKHELSADHLPTSRTTKLDRPHSKHTS